MREEQDLKELSKAEKAKNNKKSDKSRIKTEKIVMLAASVMLLSGLTATGIYMKGNENSKENLKIDLTEFENHADQKAEEILAIQESKNPMDYANSDMDFDPEWKEDAGLSEVQGKDSLNVVSGQAKAQTHVEDIEAGLDAFFSQKEEEMKGSMQSEEARGNTELIEESSQEAGNMQEVENVSAAVASTNVEPLSFSDQSQLAWPIVGDVIMNYSMDATVYYQTLDQYKYQPGMVIGANEGASITAAANCQVTEIKEDAVLGNTLRMDLGNGYEMIYGQLDQIKVKEGDRLSVGEVVACVGKPTKYYSLEGTNLYIEVRKDGEPLNPMTLLP